MNEKPIQFAMTMFKNEIMHTSTSNLLKLAQNKNNFFLLNDKKLSILSQSKCTKKLFTNEITAKIFLELENEGKIKIINGISKNGFNTVCYPIEYALTINAIKNLKRNVSSYLTFNKNTTLYFE